jgi:hypothetical protein
MKVHVGTDSKTGLVHSAVVTSANVHDKHPLAVFFTGRGRPSVVLLNPGVRTARSGLAQLPKDAGWDVVTVARPLRLLYQRRSTEVTALRLLLCRAW